LCQDDQYVAIAMPRTQRNKNICPTADQRFLAGPEEFLRTHFPIRLHERRATITTTLAEHDLLHQLLTPDPTVIGNRIFILYGAAGSGKSELLRWLQTQIHVQDTSRAAITTRITRTELDIFHLVQRLRHLYSTQPFQRVTLQRWEEARQKPRTVAKILVLTALEQLLHSDDQINVLYYQLIDIVQTNLERCFVSMTEPAEDIGQFIELFSREDLTAMLRNSVIPVPIEYETLRYHLLKTFRDYLLEGLDLPLTLKNIAQRVQEQQGQRPILLIDDLIQSINLFATDLLDYFITLEEGSWDVVVGITPNSLEATARGKELLERIAFLDTIDDRVQKLWLSDEYGLSSSFLNETNCIEYARLYLSEYKRQNQQPCNETCPAFARCHALDPYQQSDILAPFNREVLVRLFRSLPPNKGKVRYFTIALRDILLRVTQGELLLSVLQEYVQSEIAVYHPDNDTATTYELYGPLASEKQDETRSIELLYSFFDIHVLDTSVQPVVTSLYRNLQLQESDGIQASPLNVDPGKAAIKSWLQGEQVNKQLLRNVRRGMVKAIKDGYALDSMTRLYTAKPARILRWAQTRLDTVPPVQVEDLDDFDGLPLQRTVGPLAYTLHDFADAIGWSEQNLRSELITNEAFPPILFRAMTYQESMYQTLEQQLSMSIEEFAFSLLMVSSLLGACPVNLPPALQEKIVARRELPLRYPERIETERPRFSHTQLLIIRRLFEDCFKLRENVFDGFLLEKTARTLSFPRAFDLLQSIDSASIAVDFRINEEPFGLFIKGIQDTISVLTQLKTNQRIQSVYSYVFQNTQGILAMEPTVAISNSLAKLLQAEKELRESELAHFLETCHPCDLHQALLEIAAIETAHYGQSLRQLQQLLSEVALNGELSEVAVLSRHFTKAEACALLQFIQQDFRISVHQLESGLLAKLAHQLPDVYKQLEIRLSRG
jgi:hypothetical protein